MDGERAAAPQEQTGPVAPSVATATAASPIEPSAAAANPEAAATPSSPATPPSGTPAANSSPGSPDKIAKLRFQVKIAGVLMMILGSFFAFQLLAAAYRAPDLREDLATYPGGLLVVQAPGHAGANITLYPVYGDSGAPIGQGNIAANGTGTIRPSGATFRVQVSEAGKALWERRVFLPNGTELTLAFDGASPANDETWQGFDTDAFLWYGAFAALPIAVAAGGFFAFRLRAPRLAFAGAFVFVATAAALLLLSGSAGVQGIILLGTAALCTYFIYRARPLFAPWRVPATNG